MSKLRTVRAQEILDSRGTPTIEVEIMTEQQRAIASVPSGASVGVHEALELRDDDGRGVSKAIGHINESIANAVIGKEFDQEDLDAFLCELDGTANKSRLGANAILAVSIGFARTQAQEKDIPLYEYIGSLAKKTSFSLPQPLFNVLNGGKHAHPGIDIQECMLAPLGFGSIQESVRVATECVSTLRSLLEEKEYGTQMGDEGGFAPALATNEEALDLLVSVISRSGYPTEQIKVALDIAASSFYANGEYSLKSSGQPRALNREDMLEWYTSLVREYPLISIEDGFSEDDWEGFTALTKKFGDVLHIVGDDLTVTNPERIARAIKKNAINACIIKPNQIGTVTEAMKAVQTAREAGWKIFASHRSGETMDTFIADFAVGLSLDYIKAGAPTRPERLTKYNRLIEIENELAVTI